MTRPHPPRQSCRGDSRWSTPQNRRPCRRRSCWRLGRGIGRCRMPGGLRGEKEEKRKKRRERVGRVCVCVFFWGGDTKPVVRRSKLWGARPGTASRKRETSCGEAVSHRSIAVQPRPLPARYPALATAPIEVRGRPSDDLKIHDVSAPSYKPARERERERERVPALRTPSPGVGVQPLHKPDPARGLPGIGPDGCPAAERGAGRYCTCGEWIPIGH